MEWNGIENENEFYSAYFFSESLKGTLEKCLKDRRRMETADGSDAPEGVEEPQDTVPLPSGKTLAGFARTWLEARAEARREGLPAERRLNAELIRRLGLPVNGVTPSGDLTPHFPLGEDRAALPLLGELRLQGAAEPVLRIFEATEPVGSDLSDPLEMTVRPEQFPDDLPAPGAKARDDASLNWAKLLERLVFGAEHAPRWVILAGADSWVLIDRTKFGRRSVLRFDWKTLFQRREADVLDVCATLLSVEAMAGTGAGALLDELDESAHKEAYGVSDALKKSIREAIELLGNEAATQIAEKRRQQKKAFWKNQKFADDLTVECLRYMYRLLFLFFVEAKRELGYAPVNHPAYRSGYSLESLRALELIPLLTEEDRKGRFLHDSLTKLFAFYGRGTPGYDAKEGSTINYGAEAFRIRPLKGTLFDATRTQLLKEVVFPNWVLQRVIRSMSLSGAQGGGVNH